MKVRLVQHERPKTRVEPTYSGCGVKGCYLFDNVLQIEGTAKSTSRNSSGSGRKAFVRMVKLSLRLKRGPPPKRSRQKT